MFGEKDAVAVGTAFDNRRTACRRHGPTSFSNQVALVVRCSCVFRRHVFPWVRNRNLAGHGPFPVVSIFRKVENASSLNGMVWDFPAFGVSKRDQVAFEIHAVGESIPVPMVTRTLISFQPELRSFSRRRVPSSTKNPSLMLPHRRGVLLNDPGFASISYSFVPLLFFLPFVSSVWFASGGSRPLAA